MHHHAVLHYFGEHHGFDWPAWITAISTAVLAIGVGAALYSLWEARRTRDGQLVTDLARRWEAPEMMEAIVEFADHGPTGISQLLDRLYPADPLAPLASTGDRELAYKLFRWPTLIDTIGVLASEKAISSEVVYKMWGPQIVYAWAVWAEPVQRLRDLEGLSITYRYFEELALVMDRKYDAEIGASTRAIEADGHRQSESQAAGRAEERPDEQPPDEQKV